MAKPNSVIIDSGILCTYRNLYFNLAKITGTPYKLWGGKVDIKAGQEAGLGGGVGTRQCGLVAY